MLRDQFNDDSIPYDPRVRDEPNGPPIQSDLVSLVAKRSVSNHSLPAFRAIYVSAVEHGFISEQQISKQFGKNTLRMLQSEKSDPSPAQRREILKFIAEIPPQDHTGKKEEWRHEAKPKKASPGVTNYPR